MADDETPALNVLGESLTTCGTNPMTGFFRDGCCHTGPMDRGSHTVCAIVTAEFLEFSRREGNDLVTARPEFRFPGLKPGNRWCLCATRWEDARKAGLAPPVDLSACHQGALRHVSLDDLKAHALQ